MSFSGEEQPRILQFKGANINIMTLFVKLYCQPVAEISNSATIRMGRAENSNSHPDDKIISKNKKSVINKILMQLNTFLFTQDPEPRTQNPGPSNRFIHKDNL